MRIYDIWDEENQIFIGNLLYYDKKKEFIIELDASLDEWSTPLLFSQLVKKGIYRIPRSYSVMWVKERILPPGRQNISYILRNHKLQSYDEMKILELADGRCAQDGMMIKRIDALPEYVQQRREHNLEDCYPCGEADMICFFQDGTVKRVDLHTLTDVPHVDKVIENTALYDSCAVGVGGYYVTFNDSIDIPTDRLYENGTTLPLKREDFLRFARHALVDTGQCQQILGSSRQNVAYLIKKDKLHPIKENVKGNLFLKGEVEKATW